MADQNTPQPALGTDLSKFNLYGTSDTDLQNLKDAQQDILKGLENRYAQPNWFKIAAGFAKPQLGGFMASLGSASEALGENVEQQRASAIPIAQMKSQIAQSNLLLDKRQRVNKMLSDWSTEHPNEPMPHALLTEASKIDSDNPAVKAQIDQVKRIQEQQTLSLNEQKQQKDLLDAANRAGTISPENYAAGIEFLRKQINPTGLLPTPGENEQNPSESNISVLPNGARVNSNQQKLVDAGVPIISGTRTTEDQAKLFADRSNNPNPVAPPGKSKHETGNAIDVDSKNLTDEHKSILKANGYSQPFPDKDPNHWELTSSKNIPSTGKVQVGGMNMPQSEVQKMTAEEASKREQVYGSALNDIVNQATNTRGHSFEDQIHNLNTMNKLFNGVVYKKDEHGNVLTDQNGKPQTQVDPNLNLAPAFNYFRKQGFGSAVANAIQKGLQAHTPWGDIVVNAPVADFMKSMNMQPKAQERFIEFMRLLSEDRLAQSNLGLIRNEKEFNQAMSSITPESFDPGSNVNSYINKRISQATYGGNSHNLYHNWRKQNNMDPNASNFWMSPEHQNLRNKYKNDLEKSTYDLF